jgi:DNA-binding GntR family transcriptional regulator
MAAKKAEDMPESGAEHGPRYARIKKVLEQRLTDGVYPVGSLMPTEIELAADFNSSRFTIREALRKLTEEGYVERRQGVGTRVVSSRPQTVYFQSFDSLQELFQVAVETWFVILETRRVALDEDLAERVGGLAGETWIQVNGVRWTEPGGRPLCYIQCFVPERFEAVVPQFADHQGPFFSLLERHAGEKIEEVVQEIRSVPMPTEIQRSLGLREGSQALQLLRRYVIESGVLIASFNWHPAEKMTYVMRLHRRLQGGA